MFNRDATNIPTDADGIAALAERWTVTNFVNRLWDTTLWLGVPVLQLPNDLIIMQELIVKTNARVVIETGTFAGGSALYYASILRLRGGGRVISVDVNHPDAVREFIAERDFDKMITLITGGSADAETLAHVREELAGETAVIVALDSDHSGGHVLAELEAYAPFVPVDGYMVAFDTIVGALRGDHPSPDAAVTQIIADAAARPDDNPQHAVQLFLAKHPEFERDPWCDRLMVSFARGGYLKRTAKS